MGQNVVINGVTYNNIPEVRIPTSNGGQASFKDVSEANANAADVLVGKKFANSYSVTDGTMPNNGSTSKALTLKNESFMIARGYHDGTGTVSIDADEKNKIVPDNIKSGVSILGVQGSNTVVDTAITTNPVTPGVIKTGYNAYVNGTLVTGEMTTPIVSMESNGVLLII